MGRRSTTCSAMASAEVAAGDGALRTAMTGPRVLIRKSSTSEPSVSMAWARTPGRCRHHVGGGEVWQVVGCNFAIEALASGDVENQATSWYSWMRPPRTVQTLGTDGADPPFSVCVGLGCPRRHTERFDPAGGEHGVERRGELGIAVPDQEPEPVGVFIQVHEQVPGGSWPPPPCRTWTAKCPGRSARATTSKPPTTRNFSTCSEPPTRRRAP